MRQSVRHWQAACNWCDARPPDPAAPGAEGWPGPAGNRIRRPRLRLRSS